MKYNNQVTITNGVLPVDANIGQEIEFTVVLKDFADGSIHSTHECRGIYRGRRDIPVWGQTDDYWAYAVFGPCTIGDTTHEEGGWPLAQFLNN